MNSALTLASPYNAPGSASVVEVLAQERLEPSLRRALLYVLTVAAQRYPRWLLRAHRWRDELCLAVMAALEAHSLARHRASFGEQFYGLCREPDSAPLPGAAAARRRALAQVLLLLLPDYLRDKVAGLGLAEEQPSAAPHPAALPDGSLPDGVDVVAPPPPSEAELRAARRRTFLRLLWRAGSAAVDGANLLQLLLFMFGRSRHATLAQRLLGLTLRRVTAADLAAAAAPMAAAPAPAPKTAAAVLVAAWRRLLALLELPLSHARQLLLLSVFGYQFVEWWHRPDHAPLPPPALIPPPPPPPPLLSDLAADDGKGVAPPHWRAAAASGQPHVPGLRPPPEPGLCGVCRMAPREPTAAPSGFVFCASCARDAVARDGRCPLSGMPMELAQLRRLYETSSAPRAGAVD